jgi:hypothetical protein
LHVSAFTTMLVLRLNQTLGTWRPLLSRLACSPPLQALRCNTIVMPTFLAPIKSLTKSRVFSKPSHRTQLSPSKPRSSSPLSPSARVPRIPPAPSALEPSPTTCRPSTAVGHRAKNPAHAVVPPAGPPRHHRRPENHANTRSRKTPKKFVSSSLLIFLAFLLNF